MIQYFIPLIASWLPFWVPYLLPVFCLCFITMCGRLIHSFFRG